MARALYWNLESTAPILILLRVLQGIEKIYLSAVRIAAPAFIQDPLTLDVILNAPALTHQGIVLARDRLRTLSRKRRQSTQPAD